MKAHFRVFDLQERNAHRQRRAHNIANGNTISFGESARLRIHFFGYTERRLHGRILRRPTHGAARHGESCRIRGHQRYCKVSGGG